ncbi:hypothetical protein AMJ82_03445, partial [candidate division TA06 bacterium SM23_40]
ESFMKADYGAMAYLSAVQPSYTIPNHDFDKQLYQGIYDLGIWTIGYAENHANAWIIPVHGSLAEANIRMYLWLGDPETDVWTAVPQDMTVSYPAAIPIGTQPVTVSVSMGGSSVEDALVCLLKPGEVYEAGYTDAAGQVTLTVSPTVPGQMAVTVTAHNGLPYTGTIQVIQPEGPYIILDEYLIDDSVGGNNDGQVDIGEPIRLPAALKNVGVEAAQDVDAVLATDDPYMTISDNYEYYGDINPDQVVWCPDDYDFEAKAVCPDGHTAGFSITAEDIYDSTWTSAFNIPVHAPVLAFESYIIDDTGGGNGNGRLEPGETAELTVTLANEGSGFAASVEATLSTIDPYVTVVSGSASYGNIAAGGTGVGSPAYVVEAAATAPEGRQAQLDLTAEAQAGYVRYDACWVTVGGIFDDMEQGPAGWTHEVVTPGYYDQWHQSTELNHTPGGSVSWKCGDTGPGNYADSLDAGLMTVELILPENPVLTFWHWMDAEASSMYPDSAYDGGLVEISIDGGLNWTQIMPEEGYTHAIRPGSDNPLPGGTMVYSGSFGWTQAMFDLAAYSGQTVQFRFRFASDWGVNREGWYIDDVLIAGQPAVTVMVEPDAYEVPRGGTLGYTATVQNLSSSAQSFYGLIEAWLPNGSPYSGNPLVGPRPVTLAPGGSQSVHLEHPVPAVAPLGEYLLRVKVGNPPADLLDQDFFHFRVVP